MTKTAPSTSPGRSRFFDLMHETGDKLSLIKGYQQLVQPLLEEAIVHIQQHKAFKIDAHIQNKVCLSKKECSEEIDVNNLTIDERAAIKLYTMESKTEQESLFYVVNSTLRLADRSELKPILLYLRLLIEALEKLPSLNGLVYRGVNGNISSNFVKGKKLTWWGFSSCTRSLEMLSKEEFLGNNGQRTLFYIKCINGKLIQNYSYSSPDDEEVLLLPGTEFLVTGKKRANRDLTIVHLREIPARSPTADDIETVAISVAEMAPPEEVDYRDEAKEKICGHYCNLWATKQCCNCSGLYF
ncbi:unnamed protein product [Rotaria sordida]|uniref:NAD(P)(+)--arginine ADP-ribosyltransferase n=1 Tax=Rotaria sordida TaxID=392033 RepID=A0A815QDL6_9BILA|nr:unnamed protein product [Rotaria sordida]CAF1461853.1 unnamed protein product [Rotaria sordida]CAF4026525.1 unnamed protein product [Rotaria sordida]CAF4111291.1 unnamed protein product [Rotaria sordida]